MPIVQTIARTLPVIGLMLLTACGGGGGGSGTSTPVADSGTAVTALNPAPATTPTPTPTPTSATDGSTNGTGAPVISGQPVLAVSVGERYDFQPAATDPGGDRLIFSIANLPRWASFNTTTGALLGTPGDADVGSYNDITISVADATHKTSLQTFAIAVTQISTGSATVSWVPPLKNTDGSALTDLSGFQIHFGRTTSSLNQVVKISNSSISRYVVENLSAGAWYFAVSAVNSKGVQSALSAASSKVIG